MSHRSRRDFLADVGRGMLAASVGTAVASDLGLASARAAEGAEPIHFGDLEPLVALMQETPADKLLPQLVQRLKSGTELRTLVAAGALANARTFAGEDYIGFHTFMALGPAWEMSRELPTAEQPLPVLKVLHRNAVRMQAQGGHEHERLHAVTPAESGGAIGDDALQVASRARDLDGAEATMAALTRGPAGEAFGHLQYAVQDEVDVHRVVLSWRAWSMLQLAGEQYAEPLLRQSVRYCVASEKSQHERQRAPSPIRQQLPKLFDQHKLLSRPLGTRIPDDAWVDELSMLVFSGTPAQAADAAAAALADGISPEAIGEAISLAANRLVLHDPGRTKAWPEKPIGSVHGDSVGVHASDSANAWRNIARVSNQRNTAASLIVGAFHTAGQSVHVNKQPYPLPEQLSAVTSRDPSALLLELEAAIRAKDQFQACALATRYAEAGAPSRAAFDVLLKFATSEEGALHAEKYYRTVSEELRLSRPAFRPRHLAALARVTASEYGLRSAGYAQAKELLG